MSFAFPLSTTGAISFNDHLLAYAPDLASKLDQATAARASLRGALKLDKHSNESDPSTIVAAVEDYLPHLQSIVRSLQSDDLILRTEPVFSWRPALTDSLLPSAPRQTFPGLLAEHIFTLYTYLSVLALSSSLLARSQSSSNGVSYELSPSLPAAERRIRDEHVGRAADGLCRAAGVAEYLLPLVGQWEQEVWTGKGKRPVEGSRSFTSAVAKVLLADAQLLSIRKLLSPTLSTSPHVGPPLAKGHPSPSLLAKLYLSVLSFYSQAFTLLSSSSSSRSKGSEDTQTDAPIPDLVKYVKTNRDFVQALSRKWLGVDAGESAGGERIGEAIAWLKDAKATLAEGSRGPVGKLSKSKVEGKWKEELDSVNAFLSAYEKSNNSVYFSPVPPITSLFGRIPAGRSVISVKPYMPQKPVFGPGSDGYESRGGAPPEEEFERMGLECRQVSESQDGPREGYY